MLQVLAALRPGLAFADTDNAVVVTATRTDRPALEIPASVDRVYAEDIRFARPMINLSESLARVPGVVVQNRYNYAQDLQVSSRGFGARSTFGIRGLRLYADGIPATMPDGQGQASSFSLGSAERIEVLRGPFSALYGNASGGVINVITESGPAEPRVWLDTAAGSFGTRRYALKAGNTSGRANWIAEASTFDTEGYREHSAATRDQVNAKLRYESGPATTLSLIANSLRQQESQDPLGLSRAQVESNPRQADPSAIAFNTRKSVLQDQGGVTLAHALDDGAQVQAAVFMGQRSVRQFLAFSGAAPVTSSGGVVDLDRGYGGANLRYSRRASLLGAPLTVSLGAEYERMSERRRGFVNEGGVAGPLRRDEDDTVSSLDGYAQAEWRFAPQWIAHAGARMSRVSFRSTDYFIVPGNPDDSGSRAFSNTSPMAGIVYRVSPSASLYANYGRGFETPTFAELAYRSTGTGLNFALSPSRSRQVEAGVKIAAGARGRVTAALFDVDVRDELVVDSNVGGRSVFRNAGRTRRSGAEVSAERRFAGGFDAYAAWTALDARYREGFTSSTLTVPAGNVLPGIPRTHFYGEARWRHEASGFTAALEFVRNSRVAVNDANSEFAPGYGVMNMALGFSQRGEKWKLSEFLRIDNLTDRRVIGSVIVNEANGRYYEPSPGRNAMLGIQASLSF
jgi:iron complex outermembrane receptor protein